MARKAWTLHRKHKRGAREKLPRAAAACGSYALSSRAHEQIVFCAACAQTANTRRAWCEDQGRATHCHLPAATCLLKRLTLIL